MRYFGGLGKRERERTFVEVVLVASVDVGGVLSVGVHFDSSE